MESRGLDHTGNFLPEKILEGQRELPLGIADHSDQVQKGYMFLAYPGESVDGRDFIAEAISAGALIILWESQNFDWREDWVVKNIPIENLRYKAGLIANYFYKNPSKKMWVVGVTGTNGKTSCASWISACLNQLGYPTASMGTMGCSFKKHNFESQNTTPGSLVMHKMLDFFRKEGATDVAMEVSSHGLSQGRVAGVAFDTALFTNLSRDHLDYHKTIDRYQSEKRRLFFVETLKTAVINSDDKFGKNLITQLDPSRVHIISYGKKTGDIRCHRIKRDKLGMELHLDTSWGKTAISTTIMGDHNVYNILGVFGVLIAKGLNIEAASAALSSCEPIEGRMQAIRVSGMPLVVVDYAHTPDALEKSLQSLAQLLRPPDRLYCVFGCGGERDTGKRSEMGKIATSTANRTFITNDNPRFEDPRLIIEDILKGANSNFVIEQDRAKAISKSINEARPNDVVLIAGKGHENYQDLGGKKLHFSDVEEAEKVLLKKANRVFNV